MLRKESTGSNPWTYLPQADRQLGRSIPAIDKILDLWFVESAGMIAENKTKLTTAQR